MSFAFRVVAGLAAAVGRDAPVTVALVFARIGAAGPSGVLQATLARELRVSDAALSRALRALEVRGVVSTMPDPADGRHRIVRVTDKGAEVIQTVTRNAAPNHVGEQT